MYPFSGSFLRASLPEKGVYGDLSIIHPKPYSIYLSGTMPFRPFGFQANGKVGFRQALGAFQDFKCEGFPEYEGFPKLGVPFEGSHNKD